MAWIARDQTGSQSYRIFGSRPVKRMMVSYAGERMEGHYTWTLPGKQREDGQCYKPLSNDEPTSIHESNSPISLEPGEGPVEVRLLLIHDPAPRPFEGAGI